MDHAGYYVDILDDTGAIVGKKPRGELNKATDIHHTAFIFLVTPRREIVCSVIPTRKDRPTLFAGQLGATAATIRRSGETALQAAERGVVRELGIQKPSLRELGEQMLLLPSNVKVLATTCTMIGEAPENFNRDDIDGLVALSLQEVPEQLQTHPKRFAPTFVQLWDMYGHLIA